MTNALASPLKQTASSSTAIIADGLADGLSDTALQLLEARGIDAETAIRLGWRSVERGKRGEVWIAIPHIKGGRVVNHKYRTLGGEKQFSQDEGGEKVLYNVDALEGISEDQPIVVTEGEMDCAIALQCGYIAVSAGNAPATKADDPWQRKYDFLEPLLQRKNPAILAVDGDEKGANLLHDLSIRLGKHRCKWVKYPKGCKDLNDAFQAYGERGVKETLDRAQWVHVQGLYRLFDLPPLPARLGLITCIDGLDDLYRIRKGDLSVITGIPGSGKSTFVNHLAFNMNRHHGWHVAFGSFEQPPQTMHRNNLRRLHAGRPVSCLGEEENFQADRWIHDNFTFIVPDRMGREPASFDWFMGLAAAAVVQNGADIIVLDPWNELEHDYPRKEMSQTEYIGMCIRDMKRFAHEYQVHFMVAAHPSKKKPDAKGDISIPTPYDISDSAHWFNKPDQCLIVHPGKDKTTLFRVDKCRDIGPLGKKGDQLLRFDDHSGRYHMAELTNE